MSRDTNFRMEFDMGTVGRVDANIDRFTDEFMVASKIVLNTIARQIERYARTTARWKDQTGNARQGLHAKELVGNDKLGIILRHRMEYGYWLELAHGRKYKILEEALEANVGEFLSAIKELL